MIQVTCQVTILFDDPFWVLVAERTDERGYAAARAVLGAEPSEAEWYAFLTEGYDRLPFTDPQPAPSEAAREAGYKRRQRESRRALAQPPRMTRAQAALQQQYEQRKQARREESAAEREAREEERFRQRQEKRRQQHRGR